MLARFIGGCTLLLALGCAPDSAAPSSLAHEPVAIPKLRIHGAGATFPAPVYRSWARRYSAVADVRVRYDLLDSQGGIQAISNGELDFGATDMPLDPTHLANLGLVQFPTMVGGVVPVVHLPGVGPGQLSLTPTLLAHIFLGRVTRWDDPAIARCNPDLALPDHEITVVYRSDPSGTAWVFTRYLSRVSPEWGAGPGPGEAVEWPVGVGADGNAQLSEFVGQFKYTIGFLELSQAQADHRAWVGLLSPEGDTLAPTLSAIDAASTGGHWTHTDGVRFTPTTQPRSRWPISAASYALVPAEQPDPERARALLSFFHWGLSDGDTLTRDHDHVPVPTAQIAWIEADWEARIHAGGAQVWTAPPPPQPPPEAPP